jgi:hypothetical protein
MKIDADIKSVIEATLKDKPLPQGAQSSLTLKALQKDRLLL